MEETVPIERIERLIFFIRGRKVMMDSDLANLYGVETKRLNEQVKRNPERFPPDFMLPLTIDEWNTLRSQIATSKRGGRRTPPNAFTEQGVAMLSTVINSKRAVQVNIQIMRTFVRLRQILSSNKAMSQRLEELEKKYDGQFRIVFDAIRQLMRKEAKPKKQIGFQVIKKNSKGRKK